MSEERKSKVYVANFQADRDFTQAEKFGEVVFITQGYLDLKKLDKFRLAFEEFLERADASDYIILTGPSVIKALVIVIWYAKFGYVNILSWNKRENIYIHNVVGLDNGTKQSSAGVNKDS